MWDTDSPGGVHFRGDYYVADGVKRGPAPAHDIPIWVGSYKPRMLALTGAYADGWLPTLEYLEGGPDTVPGLNARIDEAAGAAGRSPGDVRRLLNIMNVSLQPASRGLLDAEIAPAVRELVAAERGV